MSSGWARVALVLLACSCKGEPPKDDQIAKTGTMPSDDMVTVPGGWFVSGCPYVPESASWVNARDCVMGNPPREVWVSSFQIERLETSRAHYSSCVDAGACTPSKADRDEMIVPREKIEHERKNQRSPIVPTLITFDQAVAYCSWRKMRLPTEAEWEKAARGTDGRMYPWGNDRPDCRTAELSEDALDTWGGPFRCRINYPGAIGTHPKDRSPYGALDMAGNVAEWNSDYRVPSKGDWSELTMDEPDWGGVFEFADPEVVDPIGPTEEFSRGLRRVFEEDRVTRGGADFAAVGIRSSALPAHRVPSVGTTFTEGDEGVPFAGVRCVRPTGDGPSPPPRSQQARYQISVRRDPRSGSYEIKRMPLPPSP